MTSRCPHVNILGESTEQVSKKTVCDTCKAPGPNLWACMYFDCLYVGCDENRLDHQTNHYKVNNEHCLALNLSTFRIWCYECECEVFLSNNYPPLNKRIRQAHVTIANADHDSDDDCFDDDHSLKPRGLTGLQNIGNTCYMNAAIQALSNCPPMTHFFLDCGAFVKGETKPGLAKTYCKLMWEIWHKRRPSYVNPSQIVYLIKVAFPIFRGCNQQDSQELLRCFMDQLHEEMKEPYSNDNISRIENSISMDIDISPEGSDSADDSSLSEAEYETCESGMSSDKSSSSEKTSLMMEKYGGDNFALPNMKSPNNFNHRKGKGGSKLSSNSKSTQSLELGPSELMQAEPQLGSPDLDGSDATSDQSVIEGSTALLLSRPSSSTSSIHDKPLPTTGHLLKGLSVSSLPLKTPTGHSTNTGFRRCHIQPQVVQKMMSSVGQTKTGRKKKQPKYRSIISDVFGGKILSSVQCLTCDRVSSTKETFQDLSLPIPSRECLNVLHASQSSFQKANSLSTCTDVYSNQGWLSWMFGWMKSWFWGPTVSLQDCLSAFFSADELEGDNMYSCEKCKMLRNGIKYSKVLNLPEILCIHLKRFRHEVMFSSKITNYVSFPLEDLDMQPFLYKDCSTVSLYDLVAVICHHGTAVGGHYITYSLNCVNDQWYEFDDQCVTEVDPQTVAKSQAYVLFYRKTSEEMIKKRQRAVELLEISKHEPSLMQFYISKQWVNTFNTFAEPGPINNSDFLCVHGGVQPSKFATVYDLCTVLSQGVWEYLVDSFGGGPPCQHLYLCTICESELKALENRRKQELEEFLSLRKDSVDSSSTNTCAISMSWFRTWENFVRGRENEAPGPIDNSVIAVVKGVQTILKTGSDHALISLDVWQFLHRVYGGGPFLPLIQPSTSPASSGNAAQTTNASPTSTTTSTTTPVDVVETKRLRESEGEGDVGHVVDG